MHFFFADDSAYKSSRQGMGKIVAFGGILVPAEGLRELSRRIDEVASHFGIPPGEEIKWSPRKGSWIYENLKDDARVSCYSSVLTAALEMGCKAVVVACDYEMRKLKPEWGFERCVTYALERVSTHVTNLKSEAVIIADRPSGGHKEADQFLGAFIEQLESNHNHMLESSFALNMLTAQSHMVRHLQLADLVVAITTAMVSGQVNWAQQYFDVIKPMFLTNSLGFIGGTGLKVYPDRLINLYHWVLGESYFSKAGAKMGWPLPNPKWAYATNPHTAQ